MARKLILLLCMAVLLIGGRPLPSFALSCAPMMEAKEALKAYDAVFTGVVQDVREEPTSTGGAKRYMDVQVLAKWKGIGQERVTLVYDVLSGFEPGESYLFYAYKTSPKRYLFEYREGELATEGVCSRTARLSEASQDLPQLGRSYAPVEPIPSGWQWWAGWSWLLLLVVAVGILGGILLKQLKQKR